MMGIYLNRQNCENTVILLSLLVSIDDFLNQPKAKEMFGSQGLGDLKRSRAFLDKAMRAMSERLDQKEALRIHNFVRHHKVMVKADTEPEEKPETRVSVNALYDMAELAMGNSCVGCTKQDFRECKVFDALQRCNIPAAQEVTEDCPYRQ
ncbi:hypothetical protein BSNK01_12260 [Bacillaceae bacterium]